MSDKIKILIVEDETAVASMMAILLNRAGCEVLIAPTGQTGMKLALESKFHLIALDIDLPDINGFEICREIKQRHFSRQTPVVFVSGRPCNQDIKRGLELGAVDYIPKPFGMEFASRLLSHIKLHKKSEAATKNGESDHARVSHDIADKAP